MARAAKSTRPVHTPNDAIQSLEAAGLVCYATPKKKPVHQVRTWTRRVEAQLELIAQLPDAPAMGKQRDRALRILKKLRCTASAVRDLDVERDLIRREAAITKKEPSQPDRVFHKQARKLRRELKQRRHRQADSLQSFLKKIRKELPLVFQTLRARLAPVKESALSDAKLLTLVGDWYARSIPKQPSLIGKSKALHAVRKCAKLARYMVEPTPKSTDRPSTNAQQLSSYFETLQQSGGEWHDLLQLRKLAAKELGKSSRLTQHFAQRSDQALRIFKRQLAKPLAV